MFGDRPAAGALVAGAAAIVVGSAVIAMHVANGGVDFRDDYSSYSLNVAALCVLYGLLAATILRRHRGHPIGVLLAVLGVGSGIGAAGTEYVLLGADGGGLLPGASWAWWLSSFLWFPFYIVPATVLLVIFPDGRPATRTSWVIAVSATAIVAIDTIWFALTPFESDLPGALGGLSHPLGLTGEGQRLEDVLAWLPVAYLVLVVGSLGALAHRLVRSDGVQRRQLGWFALGSIAWALAMMVDAVTGYSERWVWGELIFLSLPPIGAAIGIVRYDLFDITRIVHRAVVLVAFFACAAGIYFSVVLIGERLLGRSRDDLGTAAVAVAAIAVAALPLVRKLEATARDVLYGDRAAPLAVLSRFSEGLNAAQHPESMLVHAAEMIADSLNLPFVTIELEGFTSAVVGVRRTETETFPIVESSRHVGHLTVGRRAVGEALAADERQLLNDLSHRLGATSHATQLTEELRRSREQLVMAREEERRRVRRDLHDGLGPQLAGIGLQLDLGRELMNESPLKATSMITRAKEELDDAIVDVRRLVEGLRPPALDELGLIDAIRQQTASLDPGSGKGLTIVINDTADIGPLPAAVEVAAYRIAVEAVTNAVRHSHGKLCEVSINQHAHALEVEIRDDGDGINPQAPNGVGLDSVRERAEELGGDCTIESSERHGTRVLASLPLP